jgi:hypothetical protein
MSVFELRLGMYAYLFSGISRATTAFSKSLRIT